jgi:hypothetical protein
MILPYRILECCFKTMHQSHRRVQSRLEQSDRHWLRVESGGKAPFVSEGVLLSSKISNTEIKNKK